MLDRTKTTPGPWEWRGNQLYSPTEQTTMLRDVTFWNQDPGDKLLIAACPELRDVYREASGIWRAFEYELRAVVGNTNYAVLAEKIEAATKALNR